MSKIYVISDLHFGHGNITKHTNRPFESVEKMDEIMINNWNNIVTNKDFVYILGDISFYKPKINNELLKKLKGHKILVKGNHDDFVKHSTFDKTIFDEIVEYKEIKYQNRFFIMSHYPILCWNCKHYGSIHLYGHVHNLELKELENTNSYNVGVDVNEFKPVLLDDIMRILDNKGD